jgi:hypothetical protein
MHLSLRTFLIAGALAPLAIKWLWDVRAEWLPLLPIVLFGSVAALYVVAMAMDADGERL